MSFDASASSEGVQRFTAEEASNNNVPTRTLDLVQCIQLIDSIDTAEEGVMTAPEYAQFIQAWGEANYCYDDTDSMMSSSLDDYQNRIFTILACRCIL